MNLNQKIQSFLTKHKNTKRRLSATALLSLLIAVAVVSSLIMPAISMTASTISMTQEIVPLVGADDTTADDDFSTYDQSTAYDIASGTSSATMNLPDSTLTSDKKEVQFSLSFAVPAGKVSLEQRYIYYQITDDNIEILNSMSGKLYDEEWSKNKPSGYYEIGKDGLIKIKLTEEYLTERASQIASNGIKNGIVNFTATVTRDANSDGNQEVSLGGSILEIPFLQKTIALNKEGTLDKANKKITWTITVQNGTSSSSLNGKTLSDSMLPANVTDVTVKDQSGTVIDAPGTFDENGNFTFNQDLYNQVIYFTYDTDLTEEQIKSGSISNTSELNGLTSTKQVALPSMITFTKNGTADYNISGVTPSGKIQWEIRLTNEYGFLLDGYSITDSMFAGKTLEQLGVKAYVNGVETSGILSEPDSSGTVTLTTNASEVILKYETVAVINDPNNIWNTPEGNKNTASFSYNGTNGDTKYGSVNYIPFQLNKTGTANQSDGTVNWKVEVTKVDGSPSLDGYKLTDEAFKDLNAEDIRITYVSKNNNSYNVTANITKDTSDSSTIIINGDVDTITLEYTTPIELTDEQIAAGSATISNNVALKYPGGETYKTASGSTYYTVLNNVYKTAVTQSEYNGVVDSDNSTRDVEWQVTLEQDAGFANKEFFDKVSADTSYLHYITSGNALTITMKKTSSGAEKTLELGTDYTIKYYSDEAGTTEISDWTTTDQAKSFRIIFSDTVADYRYATITYKTVADVSGVKPEKTATYKNTATFNGKSQDASYSFTRKATNLTKTLNGSSYESGVAADITSPKSLSWTVVMEPSDGFYEKVLIDTLSATNGGVHYISPSSVSSITLTGTKSDDTTDTVASSLYTITFYDASGNVIENFASQSEKNATKFQIEFDSSVDTSKYKKIVVNYATLADVSGVTPGTTGEFSNTATFGDKSAGSDQKYQFQSQDTTINKQLDTSPTSVQSPVDMADEKIKTLDWIVTLRPGIGFAGQTMVDVLQATENGQHYITPDQVSKIVVKTTTGTDASQASILDSSLYTIKFYSDAEHLTEITPFEGDAKAKSFSITFKEGVDAKIAVITYQTSADISGLAAGENSVYSNTASFNSKESSGGSYTFTRQDTTISKTLKTSSPSGEQTVDASNSKQEVEWSVELRPGIEGFSGGKIFADVLQADNGGEHYITPELAESIAVKATTGTDASQATTLDSSLYTIKFYSDAEHQTEITPFEGDVQAKSFTITFAEGVDTALYRIVTIDYKTIADVSNATKGTTASFTNTSSFNGKESSGNPYTFTVKDTNAPYQKIALDKTGAVMTASSRTLSDVQTQTIGDTEYYIFTWVIDNVPCIQVVDILPEGFTLCADTSNISTEWVQNASITYNASYYQNPMYIWKGSGYKYLPQSNDSYNETYVYDSNTRQVTFRKANSGTYAICYSAKIPKATLDEQVAAAGDSGVTISNSVSGGDYDTVTSTQKITQGSTTPDQPEEKDLLTKNYATGMAGYVTYGVNFNPDGKTLSNGSTVLLKDILTTGDYTSGGSTTAYSPEDVVIELDSIKVYEVDGNSTDIAIGSEPGTQIADYTAVLEQNVQETEQVDITDKIEFTVHNYGYMDLSWQNTLPNLNETVTFKLKVTGTPNAYVTLNYDSLGVSGTYRYDENGILYLTLITSNKYNHLLIPYISDEVYTSAKVEIISASYTNIISFTAAQMELTVPDSKHLYIEYVYKVTKNGQSLNDTLGVSNTIAIDSSMIVSSATSGNVALTLQDSSGSTSTGGAPTIYKTDVGNALINNLIATFKIAKYDGTSSSWLTASEITGTDEHTVTAWTADGTYTFETTALGYKINLTEKTLYRLTEIKAPEDGYETVVTGNEPVYYFIYKGTTADTAYPSDLDTSKIMSVQSTINIPNNKLISVTASKEWSGTAELGATIEATIYWSTQKRTDDFPTELHQLRELDSSLQSEETKTISVVGETGPNQPTAIWSNLPNGKDGKAIYYYIKETAYTIGDTRYVLQDDGTYKSSSDTEGSYKPSYTGNGLNQGGTIQITNSQGLKVQKLWQNSDGTAMDSNSYPADAIKFDLYGKTSETAAEEKIGEFQLPNSNGDWEYEFSDEELNGYTTGFRVKETQVKKKGSDTFEAVSTGLYGYVVSEIANTNGTTGLLSIINKDNTPTNVDVSVEKTWGDGNSNHTDDTITVKLYQSTNQLTTAQLKAMSGVSPTIPDGVTVVTSDDVELTSTLSNENNWKAEWTQLPYKNDSGVRLYYYAIETNVPDEYEVSYFRNDKASEQTITINNYQPGGLVVNKVWENSDDTEYTGTLPDKITIELYQRLKSTSSGSDTPATTDTVKIMAMGDSITDGYINGDSGYRKYFYHQLVDKMKYSIDMVGSKDGWTSTYNFSDGTYSYDPDNTGYSGYTIVSYNNRSGIYELINNDSTDTDAKNVVATKSPDIVLLMIGTNDILDNYDISNIGTRLQTLVDEIYRQKSDVKLFIMSPPPIDSSGADWIPVQATVDASITTYKTVIQNIVTTEKAAGKICEYIDINALFNQQADYTDYLNDYCHPNETGYELMGNYLAQVIDNYLRTGSVDIGSGSTSTNAPTNITYVPNDLSESEKLGEYDIIQDSDGNWSLSISNLEKADSLGNEYVYYIREKTVDGWTVGYTANGQVISDSSTATITVTNTKTIPKLSLSVKKTWIDGNDSSRPTSLTLQLQQSTDGSTWTDYTYATPTPTISGNVWTYSYTDLPAEDSGGTKYHYRVVETVPSGYQLTTEENNNITSDSTDTEILLTNTKVISLKLKKTWSGTDGSNSVKVQLYQSTTPRSDSDVDIIQPELTASPTTISMAVNGTAQVTVNKSVTADNITFDHSTVASASVNGTTITVTGLAVGSTTMHISDGKTTVDVTVNVSAAPTLSLKVNDSTSATITAGNTATLSVSMSDGSSCDGVTYTVDPASGIVSISGNTVTGVGAGTAKIIATVNGTISNEVTIIVEEASSTILTQSTNVAIVNGENANINVPDEYSSKEVSTVEVYYRDTLTAFPNWETETNLWFNYCDSGGQWSSVGTTSGTSFNGNVAKWTYADGATNANRFGYKTSQKDDIQKIVITYKDGSTFTINNTSYVETLNMTLDKEKVTITVNSTATITASNAAGSLSCSFDPEGIATATVNGNVITVTGSEAGSTTLKVSDGTTPIDVTVTVNEVSSGGSTITGSIDFTSGSVDETINLSKSGYVVSTITLNITPNSNATGTFYFAVDWSMGSDVVVKTNPISLSGTWGNTSAITVNENVITINCSGATSLRLMNNDGKGLCNVDYTITYVESGVSTTSYTLRSTSASSSIYQLPLLQATMEAPADQKFPMTIQIDGTNDDDGIWTTIVTNLPAYDESGNEYYYWAVEDSASSAGYDVSYSFDDGDSTDITEDICINAGQLGNGEITILNTKKESSDTTMPSTGGEGVVKYYYTGGALVLLSVLAGSNRIRRRLKERRTK